MTERGLGYWVAVIVILTQGSSAWAVEESQATMQVVGTILASTTVSPAVGDTVLVKLDDGTLVATDSNLVVSDGKSYQVQMTKPTTFNGSRLTLQLKKTSNGAVYALLDANNPFSFSGGGLFPTTLKMNPTIGALITAGTNPGTGGNTGNGGGSGSGSGTGGGSGSGGGTGTGGTPTKVKSFDANGDGKSNQADIDAIKQDLAHGKSSTKTDINGDGIVNTRDVIDAIKMFRGLI